MDHQNDDAGGERLYADLLTYLANQSKCKSVRNTEQDAIYLCVFFLCSFNSFVALVFGKGPHCQQLLSSSSQSFTFGEYDRRQPINKYRLGIVDGLFHSIFLLYFFFILSNFHVVHCTCAHCIHTTHYKRMVSPVFYSTRLIVFNE